MFAPWFMALYDEWPGRRAPLLAPRTWRAVASAFDESSPASTANRLRARGFWEAAALIEDASLIAEARAVAGRRYVSGWAPLSALDPRMPPRLVSVLRESCPPVLWAKGDPSRLSEPAVAIVGSRQLSVEEAEFADAAGKLCASLGFSVFSGGARGADTFGAGGARLAGGFTAHFLPGRAPFDSPETFLCRKPDGAVFVRHEALLRNRWIYAASEAAVLVSSRFGEGGSWEGGIAAHRAKLTRLIVFMPSSPSSGNTAFARLGAIAVRNAAELREALCETPLRLAL